MGDPTTTDYLGVDTRQYQEEVEQDDQIVLAFTHSSYGRLRYPLGVEEAEQLQDDIDSAIEHMEVLSDG